MREKQRIRVPREDPIGARPPGIEVDIRRRRGRHHVSAAHSAYPGGVSYECHPARRIEKAHVV